MVRWTSDGTLHGSGDFGPLVTGVGVSLVVFTGA